MNYDVYDNYNNQYTAANISGSLARTYRWMFLGLMVTFGVGFAGYVTGAVWYLMRSPVVLIGLTILQFVLVFRLSGHINRLSAGSAVRNFFAYAVLNGVIFSSYFLMFNLGSMIFAFVAAALYFGVMALYGSRTSKDLSSWGTMLFAGLISLLVCSVLGLLFGMFGMMEILYCGVGLVVFMGLTAYDVQRLSYMFSHVQPGTEMAEKVSIYGALNLYMDFINIFLYIVRLVGRSNSDN